LTQYKLQLITLEIGKVKQGVDFSPVGVTVRPYNNQIIIYQELT